MTVYLMTMTVLIALLVVCMAVTVRSRRTSSLDVLFLLICCTVPLVTNAVIAIAPSETIARAAYLLYFTGTDLMFYSLVRFSMGYCGIAFDGTKVKRLLLILTSIDVVGVLLNPVFGHVFDVTESTLDSGENYHKLVSLWYHKVHLGFSYFMGLMVLLIFVSKIVSSSRLMRRKYYAFLIPYIATAMLETYYIFLNIPLDYSMVGYAVSAIAAFYIAIIFVPNALMDRMKSTILSSISDGIIFFDDNDQCIYANHNAELIFDIHKEADLAGVRERFLQIMKMSEDEIRDINNKNLTRKYKLGDRTMTYEIEYHRLYDGRGHGIGAFARFNDRTDEIERIEQEYYSSTHDALTGLYNAHRFYELVEQRIKAYPDRKFYALCTNVRGFKLINDRYGRAEGDRVLQQIASVIRENTGKHMLYGRLSGDRFAILIQEKYYREESILKAIGRLDKVVGPQHSLLLHVGVYEIAESDKLVSVMFDRAAMAINDIKDDLEKRVAYYSDHMRDQMLWEQKIAESLDDAVARGCVVPFLQAQVDRSGKLAGAEVLVRWNHDEEGLLLPDSFISILEKNGSIAKVDRYIWECACRILQKWTLEGNTDLYLSVNISPRDFYLLDVPETLSDLTARYGIDRSRLRLEITETIMMDDVPMKLDIIGRLRSMGFILEMDDFGSGYSSLNMLKDMPVDVIKLDMIFMSGTTNSERNDKIVNLIVKLAGELGMNVIAEGVETLDQVNSLTAMGCHAFQGYYFSRPIPLNEFESRHVG